MNRNIYYYKFPFSVKCAFKCFPKKQGHLPVHGLPVVKLHHRSRDFYSYLQHFYQEGT